jgi:glycosyltransferase involved in cell wall biosynthesis
MPRVLLEAASMRLPLVAARNPGSEAVIEDGQNGFLVDVGDAEALAERIYALARQPLLRKRFAREARIMAVRQFDHTVIARMTASHYDRLLAAVEPSARPRPPERLDETEDELSGGTASA